MGRPKYPWSREMGGHSGGSAAMRRPKRVPLPHFRDRIWSVSCLPSPLTISAAGLGRVFGLAAREAGPQTLAERVKNRRDTMRLAKLDDRMLADIGLSRGDLRDAFAVPPWRDPSDVLVRRVAERRASRRQSTAAGATFRRSCSDAACPVIADDLRSLGRSPSAIRPERRFPLPPSGCCARRPPAGAFFLSVLQSARRQQSRLERPASLYMRPGDRSERPRLDAFLSRRVWIRVDRAFRHPVSRANRF